MEPKYYIALVLCLLVATLSGLSLSASIGLNTGVVQRSSPLTDDAVQPFRSYVSDVVRDDRALGRRKRPPKHGNFDPGNIGDYCCPFG